MPPARSRLSETELGVTRRNATASTTTTTQKSAEVLELEERKPTSPKVMRSVPPLEVRVEWSREVNM
jgi:hypothetical protein